MIKFLLIFFSALSFVQAQESLSIIFSGDVMLDRGVRKRIERQGIESVFKGVDSLFKSSDFCVVNLECPFTDSLSPARKKYTFRAEPKWLSALKNAGISHCELANNHSYDQGVSGLIGTAKNLGIAGLKPIGYGETYAKACEPTLIEKNGFRIAIFSSVLLSLEAWKPSHGEASFCNASAEELGNLIKAYKTQNPNDIILLFLHWGVEYQCEPSDKQRMQAKSLIKAGADAIIGTHPHVVQKMELINNKPVFYSIGNLVFDQSKPEQRRGELIKFYIKKDKSIKYEIINIEIDKCFPKIEKQNVQ